MRSIWTVTRRELRALFDHPTGYILLIVFVVVNDFLFFRQVYLTGVASLRPMLDLLPWLLLFFVPAATMRAIAEDYRAGMLEVVLAHPLTEAQFVVGKFLGQLLFVWIALALTVPVAFGLALGADVHAGVMVAQYVGAALLAAGLTAVGLWASSTTPNQITAFIVAVAVLFLLILVGWDPIVGGAPAWARNAVESIAILMHFENIARGVIDLRDVVYFATLGALFVVLAYAAVMRRKLAPAGGARRRLRIGIVLLAAILVVVNLFGRHIGGRLDLTPGGAYTLSDATKRLVGDLDDLVTITFYASDDVPVQARIVKRDIQDLLADLRSAGGGNVRVHAVDPADDPDVLAEARSVGVPPVQFNVIGESELQVKEGYLGLAVRYADGVETIPFVQRTEDLEYRLASFIRSLTRTTRSVVGVVEADRSPGATSYGALRQELGQQYDVRTVSPTDSAPIADDVEALLLVGQPGILGERQRERFGAFLERGGSALVMAPGAMIEPRNFMASTVPVGWNALLEPYGVSIRPDLVYDLASNESVSFSVPGGRILAAYPFWVRARGAGNSVVSRDIEGLLLPWASSIDTSGVRPGTLMPLFFTSRAGGVERGQVFITPRREFSREGLAPQLVAAAVNPLAASDTTLARGRIVVVGNAEFVADQMVQSDQAGLVFVLNAVDWLAQDDALIQIRSKDRRPPPLVRDPARDAAVKYANVIGVPLLLVAFGTMRLLRRRKLAGRTYEPAARGRES